MSGNPGGALRALSPTPPERGSFPLDHDKECVLQMQRYLECMKLVKNENAPNCRLLAKEYLRCRMEHQLMDRDEWEHLGLPRDTEADVEIRRSMGETDGKDGKESGGGKHFGESEKK